MYITFEFFAVNNKN